MEYQLTIKELEDVVDQILDEDLFGSIGESMIETILFEDLDDSLPEPMSAASKEVLEEFDKNASKALERKIIEKIAAKHGVSVDELLKISGV